MPQVSSAAIIRSSLLAMGVAANAPFANMQLQACMNEDLFHFGTLYKTKLKSIQTC
jgi:hypothetical protein